MPINRIEPEVQDHPIQTLDDHHQLQREEHPRRQRDTLAVQNVALSLLGDHILGEDGGDGGALGDPNEAGGRD